MKATPLRVPPSEAVLLPLAAEVPAAVALCNTAGRGQFAAALAQAQPDAQIALCYWDLAQLERTRDVLRGVPETLTHHCQPDFPDLPANLAALCLPARGENEFARDLIQQAAARVRVGGRLLFGTDNPRDTWLHGELRERFDKVSKRQSKQGVAYVAVRTAEPAKLKNYDAEYVFRDGERLVKGVTRPGVFAHRKLDSGARALISTLELKPGMTVLDLGCGSGAVAIAAALRADVRAVGMDCNPRAVQCLERGAAANGVEKRVRAVLDADGSRIDANAFDVALANPPYFSNFRIADVFLAVALRALKRRGRLVMVTKTPKWFMENMPKHFAAVACEQRGTYWLITGLKDDR